MGEIFRRHPSFCNAGATPRYCQQLLAQGTAVHSTPLHGSKKAKLRVPFPCLSARRADGHAAALRCSWTHFRTAPSGEAAYMPFHEEPPSRGRALAFGDVGRVPLDS